MCIKQINKEFLTMQLSFLLSQQVYWFLSKKKIWLQTPIHLEPGHFYSFTFVLPTIKRWAGRKFFININWIPPCAKHHVTLLEQRGRPFPGRQEAGGTGQAGNTRPMTETLNANPVHSAFPLMCVKSISLLIINYHLSHHSEKKMLLSFYILKNILPASIHIYCSSP